MKPYARTPVRVFGAAEIGEILSIADCIELMERTMAAMSRGAAELPLRTVIPIPGSPNRINFPNGIETCSSSREAVAEADFICTVPAASDPVLEGRWIAPGAHLNLLGASVDSATEADVEAVARSRFFVNYRPSANAQAGELKRAIDAGAVDATHVQGEIGEVFSKRIPRRFAEDQITVYKSLGVAAPDLCRRDQHIRLRPRQ